MQPCESSLSPLDESLQTNTTTLNVSQSHCGGKKINWAKQTGNNNDLMPRGTAQEPESAKMVLTGVFLCQELEEWRKEERE